MSSEEINFFKFLLRPIFLPIIWILTMFFNLLIYNDKNTLSDMNEQKKNQNFLT